MSDYAFPEDLLDGIKTRWTAEESRQEFTLPGEATLRRLLETCYHASLRTTEGRAVHCVVAYASVAQIPDDALVLLEHPVALTDDQLVRLAPVTEVRRTLIGCDNTDEGLRIWGLFEHGHAWVQYSAGDPPGAPVGAADLPPDCLTITIVEPGGLSVSRGRRRLVRLREGRLIMPQENPLRAVNEPLGRFFCQLTDDLRHSPQFQDSLVAAEGHPGCRPLLNVYTTAVAAILERIRSRRHGGSVVISRSPLDETLAHVTYPVAGHGGLAVNIVSYYEALCHLSGLPEAPADQGSELEKGRAEAELRLASQQLIRGMNQMNLLAAVDGAVLLDGSLRIQGFGVRFPVLLPPGTTIVDAATGEESPCDRWGLRHQSVFSVCQKCEQAVGLIVSQDGRVKAVKSVEGRLHLWDGILD